MTINQSLARAASLIAVIAAVQILLQLPYLPTPLAVRFNWPGNPVGWGSPHTFAIVNLCIVAAIIAIAMILPAMLRGRRNLRWRLPNKDYWLAPERLPATIEYLQRQFLWHGVFTLLLLMGVFQLVVSANAHKPPRFDTWTFLVFLSGYLAFVLLWVFALLRKFARVPKDRSENPFG
jgi:hypothetical protein